MVKLSQRAQTVLPRLIEGTVWSAIFIEPDFPFRKQALAFSLVRSLAQSLGYGPAYLATIVRSNGDVQHGALIFDIDENTTRFMGDTLGHTQAIVHSDAKVVKAITQDRQEHEVVMKVQAGPTSERPYFSVFDGLPSEDDEQGMGAFICSASFKVKENMP